MWTYFKKTHFLIYLFFLPVLASAQECNLSISGAVHDVSTGEPISYASIYVQEIQTGDITDSLGHFNIQNICPQSYHLVISHMGCETHEIFIDVSADTVLSISLDHNSQLLDEVAIVGETSKVTTQEIQTLNSRSITQNANKDLATMLESISGVSSLKTGSGISKPVVHGLYGNRLTILNNGIAQSGQQWGVDHSPEIDPLVANRITVVKGVGALEYMGNSLGSVILVEPKKIDHEPHLHGEARYFFETNGLGNGINLEMQQYAKPFAWRAVATVKKSGDKSAPDYYLRNTGSQEANMALQLEKQWGKKWFSELYLSSFNAEIGILRGAHIGNLTDLEEALKRDEPFYTEDDFSYDIDAPSQKVNHQLLKFHTKYTISEKQWVDLTYAAQFNLRKEFDVRRSGRSEKPAMSLKQWSHFGELKYQNYISKSVKLKAGVQLNRVENTNIPETGILPLIPDYISSEYGGFATLSKSFKKTSLEIGGRYDFENRNVAAISITVPREIIRYDNNYSNLSGLIGVVHEFSKNLKIAYNVGYASRNPEVNELYSNGLHQGVGGIEEGDPLLEKETSLKNTFSVTGSIKKKLFFEGLFYHQKIDNYFFLNPQDEIRLTIRGAFPVFKYEQTNASISGFDAAATFVASKRINLTAKYSYLYGKDVSSDIPLVNMPANNIYASVDYQIPELGKFQNVTIQINNRYVFEQTNLLPEQDYVAPPPGYNLLGVQTSAERQMKKTRLKLFLNVDNLLNTKYRDYLNRQRYFADDLGINLMLGFNLSF